MIGSLAIFAILAGGGVMGFTYYYDDIPNFSTAEDQITLINFVDGKPLTKLGDENRTIVPEGKMPDIVMNAVMAAEDKNFLDHNGIDLKGIARAAWNNFSGGDTQGASTITQQYARHAAKMKDISYNRKIREAVLARRLEETREKKEILSLYLNAIYFGRGAYGVEAAAQAYFGKSVTTPPGRKDSLTVEEAAVLASVIKQPEPDPSGHQGYDPQLNLAAAQERWNYTLGNMAEKRWITPEQRQAAKYPAFKKYDPDKCTVDCVGKTPAGHIVTQVKRELKDMGVPWEQGGYRVTTTINPKAQEAAVNAARRASEASPMSKLPASYRAALVALDTQTGRVMAYYGGDDGTADDLAGLNETKDEGNKIRYYGGHPPGSTFKVYTLAAALREGIAFETRWDATKRKKDGKAINNAGREAGVSITCNKSCDLKESTVKSFNFPFYWIADDESGVGRAKVLTAAKDAGIQSMWPGQGDGGMVKLATASKSDMTKFGTEVGFGQYDVTVLDHANGMATLANRGKYNKAHFVLRVDKRNPATGVWEKTKYGEQFKTRQAFDTDQMDNLNGVLQAIPAANGKSLRGGRPASAKTGTWERGGTKDENAHAWMIGATPQIASAVWVGEKDGKAIKEPNGKGMSGGGTPSAVWKKFMDDVHEALDLPVERFPERKITGDPKHPLANGVAPVERSSGNPFCDNPNPIAQQFCPEGQRDNRDDDDQDDNNTGNNNGNNTGNGNGNTGNGNTGNTGNGNGNTGNNRENPFGIIPRPND